jgi:DNA-binding transcriptional LysR family regulator
MDTRKIRYFLALCEEQSFTRAAKRCGVSQPSLSAAIKSLERELGGSLFRRSIKRTTLSPLGISVRPHLQQIDHFAEKAKLQIAPRSAAHSISAVKTRERPVHKFAHGTVAAAAVAGMLFIGILAIHQSRPAKSSVESQATNSIVNVRALEGSMDVKTLPDGNVKGGYGEEES